MEKYFLIGASVWANPCAEAGILKAFQVVGYFLLFIKVAVPVLLIIFASVELGKAIISNDDKAIKGAISSLIRKAIAGVVIFFIPTIVDTIVKLTDKVDDKDYSTCTGCISKPYSCKSSGSTTTDELFKF